MAINVGREEIANTRAGVKAFAESMMGLFEEDEDPFAKKPIFEQNQQHFSAGDYELAHGAPAGVGQKKGMSRLSPLADGPIPESDNDVDYSKKKSSNKTGNEHIGRVLQQAHVKGPLGIRGAHTWKAERWLPSHDGGFRKADELGMFDIIGVTLDGQFVGIQVTSAKDKSSHIRELVSDTRKVAHRLVKLDARIMVQRCEHLYIATYTVKNARGIWEYEYERLTEDMLDAAIARKRK